MVVLLKTTQRQLEIICNTKSGKSSNNKNSHQQKQEEPNVFEKCAMLNMKLLKG